MSETNIVAELFLSTAAALGYAITALEALGYKKIRFFAHSIAKSEKQADPDEFEFLVQFKSVSGFHGWVKVLLYWAHSEDEKGQLMKNEPQHYELVELTVNHEGKEIRFTTVEEDFKNPDWIYELKMV